MGKFFDINNDEIADQNKKDCLFCSYVDKEPSHLINKKKYLIKTFAKFTFKNGFKAKEEIR